MLLRAALRPCLLFRRGCCAPSPSAFPRSISRTVHAMASSSSPAFPLITWQQTMLRVSDPAKSLAFYRDTMGMTLVDKLDFPQWKFSLYFLQTLPKSAAYLLEPGSEAAHAHLWSTNGVTLELTHNHDSNEVYNAGNEPGDGFGHIAFSVPNLVEAVKRLDAAGVKFKKRPEDGRMRNIAFVYDPTGYWVEIVERGEDAKDDAPHFALAQTMIRVKDPVKSLAFYTQQLGMTVVRKNVADSFTIYFLATLPEGEKAPDPESAESRAYTHGLYRRCIPVLELTHNHGTEKDAAFVHKNGNEEGRRGFGHIGFLVPDVYAAYNIMHAAGVEFHKTPDGGAMKGLAFAKDPDGYLIEIIKRGGTAF